MDMCVDYRVFSRSTRHRDDAPLPSRGTARDAAETRRRESDTTRGCLAIPPAVQLLDRYHAQVPVGRRATGFLLVAQRLHTAS